MLGWCVKIDLMDMRIYEEIRKVRGLTNYGIAKELNKLGIECTPQTIETQAKNPNVRAIRGDILCGLQIILGKGWAKFGSLIEADFLKK